jgi:hypothetical protein
VDGVNEGGAAIEDAVGVNERDGGMTVFGEAGLVFGGLLGDVHVERQFPFACEGGDVFKDGKRDGTDAVGRGADADFRIAGEGGEQGIEVAKVIVGRFIEAPLAGVWFALKAGAEIGGA